MSFPRFNPLLARVKASILAIVATLSAAANAPSADAGQLPWDQSPIVQGQRLQFQPSNSLPSALQPIPLNQPAFALQPGGVPQPAGVPQGLTGLAPQGLQGLAPQGLQGLAPQTLQSSVPQGLAGAMPQAFQPTPITQLQHPSLMTGITNYNGTLPALPGFSTAQNVGEWNALSQTNGYSPIPRAPVENQLLMKEFLTNPAMAEQMYAPQINPALVDPKTYFPNYNLESPSSTSIDEISGEVI